MYIKIIYVYILNKWSNKPTGDLKNIIINPISFMLRNAYHVEKFLKLAVDLDPTINLFPEEATKYATGTTCYQFLTGIRLN